MIRFRKATFDKVQMCPRTALDPAFSICLTSSHARHDRQFICIRIFLGINEEPNRACITYAPPFLQPMRS